MTKWFQGTPTGVAGDVGGAMVALAAELVFWPEWMLTEFERGASHGTHDQYGVPVGEGKWDIQTGNGWCAYVRPDGAWPTEHDWGRPYFFEWGGTMAEAVEKLTAQLTSRRTNPHLYHIFEHGYALDCEPCRSDHMEAEPDCEDLASCDQLVDFWESGWTPTDPNQEVLGLSA